MRTFKLALGFFILVLASCNSGSSSKTSTDTTASTADTTQQTMAMAPAEPQPAVPAGAKVFFKNLKNMQSVTSPFKVEMGLTGMTLDTAGVVKEGTGHHHLLIDAGDSIPTGQVVPKDSTHLHFGKGQSETELTLTPGMHTLTLQFADGIHRSYGSKMAATIMVNVRKK